jgi:L-2-hydroxyglutarate oxidase LhgO
MEHIQTLVIGAGAVGLAVARALALTGREVMVIERETAFGQGVSSRNSEVIHAGIYYPAGSLKAELCVRGKDMLYAYAAERNVAVSRLGKLMVATHVDQHDKLRQIQATAAQNGVALDWLTAQEAHAFEANLRCTAALHSPTTGIIDSHGLMLALLGDLENAGGVLALASELDSLHSDDKKCLLPSIKSGDVATTYIANEVINAAGLFAVDVAQRMHGLPARHIPTARFAKGHYFSLTGAAPFSKLIYPVPEPGGLGVHLTLDLGRQAKFGPDVEWLPESTLVQDLDYAVDPARADAFYAEVRKYWPALPNGALQPSYSGIRPKIVGPLEPAADFVIQTEAVHGIAGLVNLFGIESPGLTACMAIAERVVRELSRR